MPLNTDKIDDAALALLYLTLHDNCRAWKGLHWDVLGRLHDKGMIHDPVGKVKSVVFTQEGLERAKQLFEDDVQEVRQQYGGLAEGETTIECLETERRITLANGLRAGVPPSSWGASQGNSFSEG